MQIIYDNIIFSLQKAGGISIYWKELIKRISNQGNIDFYETKNENIFRKTIGISIEKESCISFKILRYLPFLKKIPSKYIFHSSYYRISLQKNIANITTVHDFTYEYYRTGVSKYVHTLQKYFAIRNSDGIICVSKNTKKDLLKFVPNIDKSKIKVIYNGVGEEFKQLENPNKYLIGTFNILYDKRYIIYIGDRSSYKNFNIAIKTIEKFTNYCLVVVGGQDFSIMEKEQMKYIQNRTFHFRAINGYELNALYNNAFCLLYPSSYEGFGIPIVEAMKAGCPVVSTKRSSIPEVSGNGALLVNDICVNSFVKAINKLKDDNFRDCLVQKGLNQVKKFSWDKCANETYKFYEEVHKRQFN